MSLELRLRRTVPPYVEFFSAHQDSRAPTSLGYIFLNLESGIRNLEFGILNHES